MIKNSAVEDALAMCGLIFNGISPNDKYLVLNIARNVNRTFTFPSIPEIPTSYGYAFDKVPQILEEEKVICAKIPNRWLINEQVLLWKNEEGDPLDQMGHTLKLVPEKRGFGYYKRRPNSFSRGATDGPTLPGQYAVIISVSGLVSFWNKYNPPKETPVVPRITDEKYFEFMGQQVRFTGELELKSVQLLVENLGSMISVEKFCMVDSSENYNDYVTRKKLVQLNDKLKKRFNAIKEKIHSIDGFEEVFLFVNQEGYGLFVDRNALEKYREAAKVSYSP